jgi:hypothetical protein
MPRRECGRSAIATEGIHETEESGLPARSVVRRDQTTASSDLVIASAMASRLVVFHRRNRTGWPPAIMTAIS